MDFNIHSKPKTVCIGLHVFLVSERILIVHDGMSLKGLRSSTTKCTGNGIGSVTYADKVQ